MIEISLTNYEVRFGPPSIEEEIAQNVRMILSTMFFEVPYHRECGLDASYLDSPIQVAQTRSRVDIIKQINKYEPRAKVQYINMSGDAINGRTTPVVGISINE
ncbi:MAG: hypothetical protein [Caudoviricetes sp.]|nr:MAG: hypothetical protein [Caudoviricetes sp.]